MTHTETITILRQFNEWRRGDYEPSEQPAPPDPCEIGEAIDAAVEMIERVANLDPQPYFPARDHNWYYAQGWNDCLKEVMGESK